MSVDRAAAAVHRARPAPSGFPRVGVISRVTVTRGSDGSAKVENLAVSLDGNIKECGCSGAFEAEAATVSDPSAFVGRAVKVELLGGAMFVAYTLNMIGS